MTTPDSEMMAELDEEKPIIDSIAWIPETAGETIIGTVLQVDERDAGYGPYRIVTIATDDEDNLAIHCMGTVLSAAAKDDDPQVGDRWAVRFEGEHNSKNGRTYKAWRTAIRRGPFITDNKPAPKKAPAKKATPAVTAAAKTVDGDGIEF